MREVCLFMPIRKAGEEGDQTTAGVITAAAGHGISQFLSEESTYMHGVYDRAGPCRV